MVYQKNFPAVACQEEA
ncbi:hypothetical protein ACHAW6_007423 [Cyclotella cf. meneghiniana]